MRPLSVVVLLFCAWIPAHAQTATFSCAPKVNTETCQIASQWFIQLTAFVRPHSDLRRITMLDPESYDKEAKQYWSGGAPANATYFQVFSGPYIHRVLFEREEKDSCPTSVFLSSDIMDDNEEMVLDEQGKKPKLDSNGGVVTRKLPPTTMTKTLNAIGLAGFLDGYSQACSGAVMTVVTSDMSSASKRK